MELQYDNIFKIACNIYYRIMDGIIILTDITNIYVSLFNIKI